MEKTKLWTSLMLVFGSSLAATTTYAQTAPTTPEAPQSLERVEITGSAIKRINCEGCLPITVLTRDDIQKSGGQSVTELLQLLPLMQSFVPQSNSVNGMRRRLDNGRSPLAANKIHPDSSRRATARPAGRQLGLWWWFRG